MLLQEWNVESQETPNIQEKAEAGPRKGSMTEVSTVVVSFSLFPASP